MLSPGQHSALALVSAIPGRGATLDRTCIFAKLRAAFDDEGCVVHTPPKLGVVNPLPCGKTIYARRHHVENPFLKLKDWSRIALQRYETRQSWLGVPLLAAKVINLHIAEFSHRP